MRWFDNTAPVIALVAWLLMAAGFASIGVWRLRAAMAWRQVPSRIIRGVEDAPSSTYSASLAGARDLVLVCGGYIAGVLATLVISSDALFTFRVSATLAPLVLGAICVRAVMFRRARAARSAQAQPGASLVITTLIAAAAFNMLLAGTMAILLVRMSMRDRA